MSTDWKNRYKELITESDASQAEKNFDEALFLRLEYLPKLLYKYRDVNSYSLENLANDTVWLASADTFNDPYDSTAALDHEALVRGSFKDVLKGKLAMPPELKSKFPELPHSLKALLLDSDDPFTAIAQFFIPDERKASEFAQTLRNAYITTNRDIAKKTLEKMQSSMKVCSFCASPVEYGLLMWGHYAKWHQGFCIAYDTSKFPNRSLLHPVIYSTARHDLTPLIFNAMKGISNPYYAHAATLLKHPDWQYEDEWRFFAPLGNETYPKGLPWPVPKPEAVYLGAKMKTNERDDVIAICRKNKMAMFQMELSPSSFELIPTVVR